MSSGSMYGIGMAWKMLNSGSASSRVAFLPSALRSGRNTLYMPSFCSRWVLQLVGWMALTRMILGARVKTHLFDVLHHDALAPAVPGAAGAHVRVVGGATDHACGGPGDDDRRPVGQVRDGDRDGVHHAEQVDIGGVDEAIGSRLAHGHREDAGIGHDDVDLAEIGHPRLDRIAQLVALADIGDPRHDPATESP